MRLVHADPDFQKSLVQEAPDIFVVRAGWRISGTMWEYSSRTFTTQDAAVDFYNGARNEVMF